MMNQYEALLRGNDAASFLSAYECFATADRELVGGLPRLTGQPWS